MSGIPFKRRDSDDKVSKPNYGKQISFKTRQRQDESNAPTNETDKQRKERRRKLEEEQKVNFKDVLEVQMSGGYNGERPAVFVFNII